MTGICSVFTSLVRETKRLWALTPVACSSKTYSRFSSPASRRFSLTIFWWSLMYAQSNSFWISRFSQVSITTFIWWSDCGRKKFIPIMPCGRPRDSVCSTFGRQVPVHSLTLWAWSARPRVWCLTTFALGWNDWWTFRWLSRDDGKRRPSLWYGPRLCRKRWKRTYKVTRLLCNAVMSWGWGCACHVRFQVPVAASALLPYSLTVDHRFYNRTCQCLIIRSVEGKKGQVNTAAIIS